MVGTAGCAGEGPGSAGPRAWWGLAMAGRRGEAGRRPGAGGARGLRPAGAGAFAARGAASSARAVKGSFPRFFSLFLADW